MSKGEESSSPFFRKNYSHGILGNSIYYYLHFRIPKPTREGKEQLIKADKLFSELRRQKGTKSVFFKIFNVYFYWGKSNLALPCFVNVTFAGYYVFYYWYKRYKDTQTPEKRFGICTS